MIAELHEAYFRVGADVVETDTFGAFAVPLGEYGIPERAHEISLASARIAREVADGYGGLVAGSMGPGTKSPSLGQIRFAELRDAYEVMARGPHRGRRRPAHLPRPTSTCSPPRPRSSAPGGPWPPQGRQVPIQLQVTMELTGTMLLGTEIGAALASLEALRPDVFGLNCATGPAEMHEHLRHLSANAPMPISCLPNAGLPSVVDGKMHYDLTPEQLVEYQTRFVTELGVQVVGGCCGSTPEHLRQLAAAVKDLTPARRDPGPSPAATSMFSAVPFHQDASFLIIGERTNANGSKKFREPDARRRLGRLRAASPRPGARGRPRARRLRRLRRPRRHARHGRAGQPLRHPGHRAAGARLDRAAGHRGRAAAARAARPILNSANLEDGEGEGSRFDRVCRLAQEYGAAVDLPAHRRGGPGPRRRVEDAGRPPHPRPGDRSATASSRAT